MRIMMMTMTMMMIVSGQQLEQPDHQQQQQQQQQPPFPSEDGSLEQEQQQHTVDAVQITATATATTTAAAANANAPETTIVPTSVPTTVSVSSSSEAPSSYPSENNNDNNNNGNNADPSSNSNPCNSYTCGDYSSAHTLSSTIDKTSFPPPGSAAATVVSGRNSTTTNNIVLNWTAVFAAQNTTPFDFLYADISCPFDTDRLIFANDQIARNTYKNTNAHVGNTENRPALLTNDMLVNVTDLLGVGELLGQDHEPNKNENNKESSTKKKTNKRKAKFQTPRMMHIHIYAIDDQFEFKYKSCPDDFLTPVIDYIPQFELDPIMPPNNPNTNHNTTNTKTNRYSNATSLRFVWNRNIMTLPPFWSTLYPPGDTNNPQRKVTLELWVPKWILESTIIVGPRFDYSLGIDIGPIVDTGGASPSPASVTGKQGVNDGTDSNDEDDVDEDDVDVDDDNNDNDNNTTTTNDTTTTANKFDNKKYFQNSNYLNNRPVYLLTNGPPKVLTVYNTGIGTSLAININTEDIPTTKNNNNGNTVGNNSAYSNNNKNNSNNNDNPNNMLELRYVDQSLNSIIRIQTDANVNGTIQMGGANMQAAIVSTTRTTTIDGNTTNMTTSSITDNTSNATFPPTLSDASNVMETDTNTKDGISIILRGFQQVVTVMGKYKDMLLTGTSIAIYTTEGCDTTDAAIIKTGLQIGCFEIDNNITAEIVAKEQEKMRNQSSPSAVMDISQFQEEASMSDFEQDVVNNGVQAVDDAENFVNMLYIENYSLMNFTNFTSVNKLSSNPTPGGLYPLFPIVFQPTCLVSTVIAEYDCNPYSSSASVTATTPISIFTAPSIILSSSIVIVTLFIQSIL